jgi:hypothetical protein
LTLPTTFISPEYGARLIGLFNVLWNQTVLSGNK